MGPRSGRATDLLLAVLAEDPPGAGGQDVPAERARRPGVGSGEELGDAGAERRVGDRGQLDRALGGFHAIPGGEERIEPRPVETEPGVEARVLPDLQRL